MKRLLSYWRDVLATIVELAGVGVLVFAAYLFAPLLGLVVLGIALLVIGYAINAR